jgi:3-deoxy-D-manno-octulosonic acid (KDO) 8-phosphate synthase
VGIDALYLEVHNKPEEAKSDGPNSLVLNDFSRLLEQVKSVESSLRREWY